MERELNCKHLLSERHRLKDVIANLENTHQRLRSRAAGAEKLRQEVESNVKTQNSPEVNHNQLLINFNEQLCDQIRANADLERQLKDALGKGTAATASATDTAKVRAVIDISEEKEKSVTDLGKICYSCPCGYKVYQYKLPPKYLYHGPNKGTKRLNPLGKPVRQRKPGNRMKSHQLHCSVARMPGRKRALKPMVKAMPKAAPRIIVAKQ